MMLQTEHVPLMVAVGILYKVLICIFTQKGASIKRKAMPHTNK